MQLGNAPCSWGVEFADDPRNPCWTQVLEECADAGFLGIELGPIGFLPEDPVVLGPALDEHGLTLAGGVVFQPFHDPAAWTKVKDSHVRTCRNLAAHEAGQVILIDSISADRSHTLGRPQDAKRLSRSDRADFVERIRTAAEIATYDFGLTASIHAHAGGYCDFEDELEQLLEDIDDSVLKLCVDTAHSTLAGFDPVSLIQRHGGRVAHVHIKDIDPAKRIRVTADRVEFYAACADNLFCALGSGEVDFSAVHRALKEIGFDGWCIVEQDCAPQAAVSKVDMAAANRNFLKSIGF